MSEVYCPCSGHSNLYAACCQPLHEGQSKATTAVQLMRSRYSAFVKHSIDYIVQTTAIGQQQQLDVSALKEWSVTTQWHHLDVLQHHVHSDKRHAYVEFKAYFMQATQLQAHHETSAFVFVNGQWYFLDPTVELNYSMKKPCICGSGKKFKACCATFL